MTFSDIVSLVCNKVGLGTDTFAQARALEYTKNRDKFIYDSFDWTATQDTIFVSDPSGGVSIDIPGADKILSARYDGIFLDPVTPSFIFESHPELLSQKAQPQYYFSYYDALTAKLAVKLFPQKGQAGALLNLLVKRPYNPNTTIPSLPDIENVLITFVLADMWEFMRQLGKYQAKLGEANDLLQKAQARDTPSFPRPRSSKVLTASGNTLGELVDSVCDVIGRWEPDIRESIKERIRRNYQTLWDMNMLPESLIIANVPVGPDQQQVVLPYFFDRVVKVRTNKGGPLTRVAPLDSNEISYYFGVAYNIFEQTGQPLTYSMLSNVAVQTLPPFREKLKFQILTLSSTPPKPGDVSNDDGVKVFVKGETSGFEIYEYVTLDLDTPKTTVNTYDTPLVITKPVTQNVIGVYGALSGTQLLQLQAEERERKHLRIWLLPNLNPQDAVTHSPTIITGSVLVCGKRKVSPLVKDDDSTQIRNCQNILINAAAGDMFDKMGNVDMANKYQSKAMALIQVLCSAETQQNEYHPTVVPYTEGNIHFTGGGNMSSSDLTALTIS